MTAIKQTKTFPCTTKGARGIPAASGGPEHGPNRAGPSHAPEASQHASHAGSSPAEGCQSPTPGPIAACPPAPQPQLPRPALLPRGARARRTTPAAGTREVERGSSGMTRSSYREPRYTAPRPRSPPQTPRPGAERHRRAAAPQSAPAGSPGLSAVGSKGPATRRGHRRGEEAAAALTRRCAGRGGWGR